MVPVYVGVTFLLVLILIYVWAQRRVRHQEVIHNVVIGGYVRIRKFYHETLHV